VTAETAKDFDKTPKIMIGVVNDCHCERSEAIPQPRELRWDRHLTLSQNSPHGGNPGTVKQRVARTLYVRVAKRQEVKLHKTAQHDTLWSFEFQVRNLLRLRRPEAVASGPPRVPLLC